MPKATRFAPPLVALLLGCSALSNTAEAGWFSSDSKPARPVAKKDDKAPPHRCPPPTWMTASARRSCCGWPATIPEAINHLSQLMLVAADDPRVVSEYGKTLVSMGRAEEAEKFLTRAQELQPNDWTIYSALGVAYDQIGNQKDAQVNYEHALALKPGEPSVLNNYALSRMLAKDPAMARKLADRAEIANASAKDDKIARNIAMIRSMAPQASDGLAVKHAGARNSPAAPAPRMAVATAPLAPIPGAEPVPLVIHPAAAAGGPAPRPLANTAVAQAQPPQPVNQAPRGVVMQAVPVDPLAGPVGPKAAVTHAPRSLQPNQADSETPVKNDTSKTVAKADAPKPAAEPAKPTSAAQSLEAQGGSHRQDAEQAWRHRPGQGASQQGHPGQERARQAGSARFARAKPEAGKALLAKSEPAKPAQFPTKVAVPVKAADAKPNSGQPVPKGLASAPVKAADAKPEAGKTAAKSKDAIPGLRLSANAY